MVTSFEIRDCCNFDQELFELLRAKDGVVSVCANGTEHTHSDFVSLLRRNDSPAAKFVRFAPDGVFLMSNNEVIHYDAKASKYIEKDAYEAYLKYIVCGCRVMLFLKINGTIYWQDVDKLKFVDGHETVSRFSEERRFPVIDGWIYPRRKKDFRDRVHPGMASGTPYREIDMKSLYVFKKDETNAD